jgi:hypothetical protein
MMTVAPLAQAASHGSDSLAKTGPVATTVKPIIGSSFIQSWYCEDWDQTRWRNELSMMKDVGISEVIIQNTVDTTPGNQYASYYTSIRDYTSNDVDLLENVLNAADDLGMSVRIGTGNNDNWWSKGATDTTWLTNEANINKLIVDEITEKYAFHSSFGGWYLSYEISNITATTRTRQANLNVFFKTIVSEMELKTPGKTVMVSPYYNSQYAYIGSLSNWSTAIKNIFSKTGVDILALQDSIGAGTNKVSQLGNIFTYTKMGTDAANLMLYANTETYTSTVDGNIPAAQSLIGSQLAAENKYVKGHVAFSINHFQGKYCSNPNAIKGYYDYQTYYLTHK